MISDLLTVVIVALMVILVVYPSAKALQQSWPDWQRRFAGRWRSTFETSGGDHRPATAHPRNAARPSAARRTARRR